MIIQVNPVFFFWVREKTWPYNFGKFKLLAHSTKNANYASVMGKSQSFCNFGKNCWWYKWDMELFVGSRKNLDHTNQSVWEVHQFFIAYAGFYDMFANNSKNNCRVEEIPWPYNMQGSSGVNIICTIDKKCQWWKSHRFEQSWRDSTRN